METFGVHFLFFKIQSSFIIYSLSSFSSLLAALFSSSPSSILPFTNPQWLLYSKSKNFFNIGLYTIIPADISFGIKTSLIRNQEIKIYLLKPISFFIFNLLMLFLFSLIIVSSPCSKQCSHTAVFHIPRLLQQNSPYQ